MEIITHNDKKYPSHLKQIYDYPKTLFVEGNSNILKEEGFAIIGCRNSSYYGEKVAMKLAYELSLNNKIIISGLARGIDSCAHIGCLKAKGKTIAVLGSGLDNIYPKENQKLAEKILENGGAIISEYKLGTKPLPTNFPARNRIISGLSKRRDCGRSKIQKRKLNYSRFCIRTRKRRICSSAAI